MSLSLKPKVAAIATSALITILALTTACNSNNRPVNTQPPVVVTPQKPAPQIEQTLLKWENSRLKYEKGTMSWEVNVGEDTENAILKMTRGNLFRTSSDFFVRGAFVEKRYGPVVVWGGIHSEYFGKVSFRQIENGSEDSNYWSFKARINDVIVVYDAMTSNGLNNYLIIAGDTAKDSILNKADMTTGRSTINVPLIEIRELTSHGSVPVSYNPVTYVNGTATGVKAVRDDKGNVTLEIATRTRTNPDGGVSSVKLADILKLPPEAPIFGR